ncbi:hypothetical protein B0H14DRAFT_3176742 [Mycena olivaceomarginata]|nr:hypothetical protein B0H14DRAFT_3176742 [Mycena olivaceomarginata]
MASMSHRNAYGRARENGDVRSKVLTGNEFGPKSDHLITIRTNYAKKASVPYSQILADYILGRLRLRPSANPTFPILHILAICTLLAWYRHSNLVHSFQLGNGARSQGQSLLFFMATASRQAVSFFPPSIPTNIISLQKHHNENYAKDPNPGAEPAQPADTSALSLTQKKVSRSVISAESVRQSTSWLNVSNLHPRILTHATQSNGGLRVATSFPPFTVSHWTCCLFLSQVREYLDPMLVKNRLHMARRDITARLGEL